MKKLLGMFTVIIALFLLLPSCGSSLSDTEVKETAAKLINESYAVNDLFFGRGLSHNPLGEDGKGDAHTYSIKDVEYSKVISKEYTSVEDLKKAALEVYSEDYCDIIFKSAFEDMKDDSGKVYAYARYTEDLDGALCVRSDVEKTDITVGRIFDTESIKTVESNGSMVIFTVSSSVRGIEDGEIKLSMTKDDAGWRLDSPTY